MASKQAKVAQRDASQKLTKKNLYFQRLLLLRYLVAFFFFFNLYWLLAAGRAMAARGSTEPVAFFNGSDQ